jgi:hypothetical protein
MDTDCVLICQKMLKEKNEMKKKRAKGWFGFLFSGPSKGPLIQPKPTSRHTHTYVSLP